MIQLKKTFSMVPSDRAKSDTTAPLSALPAIPLILPDCGHLPTLGIIDTGAATCCISDELLKDSRFSERRPIGTVSIRSTHGFTTAQVMLLDLIVASASFEPWLLIEKVRFVVISGGLWNSAGILLGYAGFLEHLNIDFNFPKRLISVSAPAIFDAKRSTGKRSIESSRLREAQLLVQNGVFDSAIVMAVAAIEEVVRANVDVGRLKEGQTTYSSWADLSPIDLQPAISSILKLRNEVVHGDGKTRFTKNDAERAVSEARRLAQILLNRSRES